MKMSGYFIKISANNKRRLTYPSSCTTLSTFDSVEVIRQKIDILFSFFTLWLLIWLCKHDRIHVLWQKREIVIKWRKIYEYIEKLRTLKNFRMEIGWFPRVHRRILLSHTRICTQWYLSRSETDAEYNIFSKKYHNSSTALLSWQIRKRIQSILDAGLNGILRRNNKNGKTTKTLTLNTFQYTESRPAGR